MRGSGNSDAEYRTPVANLQKTLVLVSQRD